MSRLWDFPHGLGDILREKHNACRKIGKHISHVHGLAVHEEPLGEISLIILSVVIVDFLRAKTLFFLYFYQLLSFYNIFLIFLGIFCSPLFSGQIQRNFFFLADQIKFPHFLEKIVHQLHHFDKPQKLLVVEKPVLVFLGEVKNFLFEIQELLSLLVDQVTDVRWNAFLFG